MRFAGFGRSAQFAFFRIGGYNRDPGDGKKQIKSHILSVRSFIWKTASPIALTGRPRPGGRNIDSVIVIMAEAVWRRRKIE